MSEEVWSQVHVLTFLKTSSRSQDDRGLRKDNGGAIRQVVRALGPGAPGARVCRRSIALTKAARARFDTFAAESIEAVFQAVLTAATQDGDEGPEAITDRSHGRCPLNQLVKVGTGRTWCEAKDDARKVARPWDGAQTAGWIVSHPWTEVDVIKAILRANPRSSRRLRGPQIGFLFPVLVVELVEKMVAWSRLAARMPRMQTLADHGHGTPLRP